MTLLFANVATTSGLLAFSFWLGFLVNVALRRKAKKLFDFAIYSTILSIICVIATEMIFRGG